MGVLYRGLAEIDKKVKRLKNNSLIQKSLNLYSGWISLETFNGTDSFATSLKPRKDTKSPLFPVILENKSVFLSQIKQ